VRTAVQELFEIERGVRGCVFEAEGNLGIAEARFGSGTVRCGAPVAKRFFDGAAKSETDAIKIARNAGLMFRELPANLGQSLLFGIVQTQALFISRIKGGDSSLQGANEKSGVAFVMGIGGLHGNGLRDFLRRVPIRRFCVACIQGFEASPGADRINVPLG
jgi:hypothetical protein